MIASVRVLAACGLIVLASVTTPVVAVRQAPDGRAWLEAVARTYRSTSSGRLGGYSANVTEATTGGRRAFAVAFDRGRVRQEAQGPSTPLIVSDGRTTWIHRSDFQQYKRIPIGTAYRLPQLEALRRADERLLTSRVVGDDRLDIDGEHVTCVVVEAEYADDPAESSHRRRVRYWIERDRGVVRREDATMVAVRGAEARETQVMTVFTLVELGPELDEALFTFQPSPGDEQVTEFFDPGQVDLTGKPAPTFELTALDGRPLSLASLRGRVVVLDFWATWCAPCVVEMPTLQRLHEEFGSQGVIIVGVNNEAPSLARRFLQRHGVTFQTVTDPRGAVAKQYGVRGIPVGVIIDRDGQVRAHFPGLRDDKTWRVALAAVLSERP